MKKLILLVFTVLLCGTTVQGQPADIGTLQWLAGCWESTSGVIVVEEQWMKPLGSSMIGMSRMVKDGKTRFHEFIQIRQRGDTLVYVAAPSGQKETEFVATRVTFTEIVFENPAHDFPQRIIYQRKDNGSLHARIEGIQTGKERVEHFPYRKVDCP